MKKIFYIYFFIFYLFLIVYANYMDIGDLEISYLSLNYPITLIENSFLYFFGNSNLSLRMPSIILSVFSIFLYYQISKKYLKKEFDIYLSVILFSIMPGFIIATLLFNKSIYLIFITLMFLYSFLYYRFYSYIFLLLFTIADYSFISLYLGLIFYSIYKKDTKFLIYSIFLLMINANYFQYDIHGKPNGYFMDIILVYFSIFSPFIFIYFIYALFKTFKKPTLLWFISTWGLFFSILLSFRQRIKIDDFAPFIIISVVFMISVFMHEYRIRLNVFRPFYRKIAYLLLFSIILFDILILSSKYFLEKSIVTQFNYTYDIYTNLKRYNINNISCKDKLLCKKLYFYGLKKGNKHILAFDMKTKKVSISHNHKKFLNFYVSKLNKK